MTTYQRTCAELRTEPRQWLITGCAGFIGSHLLETLLRLDQRVAGLDNLSTGSPANLEHVRSLVSPEQWERFTFHQGSVSDVGLCREASNYCDYVLHQAGFISVPLSIEDPVGCHQTNVTGTLNLLVAARDNRVRRFVFASSSAVYGDDAAAAKVEAQIGQPLSPYGASKLMDELYARLFREHYGLETVALRYFNVFGARQNPVGGYAAVIPQWIVRCVRGEECFINGDGGITRDFCPVENIVQANILAATSRHREAAGNVFNVALGGSTTLAELHQLIARRVEQQTGKPVAPVRYGPARPGDIIHSSADIARIRGVLEFSPEVDVDTGLDATVRWYAANTQA